MPQKHTAIRGQRGAFLLEHKQLQYTPLVYLNNRMRGIWMYEYSAEATPTQNQGKFGEVLAFGFCWALENKK